MLTWQEKIRNSRPRKNQNARNTFFFGLHLNLGAKFRTKIKLLSLTKLRKNIWPPWNLLNLQKVDAYVHFLCKILNKSIKKLHRDRCLNFYMRVLHA